MGCFDGVDLHVDYVVLISQRHNRHAIAKKRTYGFYPVTCWFIIQSAFHVCLQTLAENQYKKEKKKRIIYCSYLQCFSPLARKCTLLQNSFLQEKYFFLTKTKTKKNCCCYKVTKKHQTVGCLNSPSSRDFCSLKRMSHEPCG